MSSMSAIAAMTKQQRMRSHNPPTGFILFHHKEDLEMQSKTAAPMVSYRSMSRAVVDGFGPSLRDSWPRAATYAIRF